MKTTLAILLSIALTGCGGGGSTASPDNTATSAQQAIANIANGLPAPKPAFEGAFTSINGVSNGYIFGPSKQAIAEALGRSVSLQPTAFPEYYKALISDSGLRVTVYGEKIGTGAASGLPIYAADTIYTVTLRNDGLHVVQTN
jgi:hypothetical protein